MATKQPKTQLFSTHLKLKTGGYQSLFSRASRSMAAAITAVASVGICASSQSPSAPTAGIASIAEASYGLRQYLI